jgi:hypothetical protein
MTEPINLAELRRLYEQAERWEAGEPMQVTGMTPDLALRRALRGGALSTLIDVVEAFALLAGRCENFTGPERFNCFANGRVFPAEFGADRACVPCYAARGLATVDAEGAASRT